MYFLHLAYEHHIFRKVPLNQVPSQNYTADQVCEKGVEERCGRGDGEEGGVVGDRVFLNGKKRGRKGCAGWRQLRHGVLKMGVVVSEGW